MTLMTVREVAEMLAVSPKTLYQWAELGQIPSFKLNGALRFDLVDIQAWLKSCKKGEGNGYNVGAQNLSQKSRKGGKH